MMNPPKFDPIIEIRNLIKLSFMITLKTSTLLFALYLVNLRFSFARSTADNLTDEFWSLQTCF
jgi:hypothetical protein